MKREKSVNKKNISTFQIVKDLFPIYRCLIGPGVLETLHYIKRLHPLLKIKKARTGSKIYDWTIPEEWHVDEAWISDKKKNRIVDIKKNNLHLVGYSTPINKVISYEELQKHLYSLEKQPNAIPYVTSYYKKTWGFCLQHSLRKKLKKENYRVFIKSKFKKGSLSYGELYLPGKSKKEIFFSTYICHPSMANNELSGPSVAIKIIEFLKKKKLKYSYRIIFIPETIGSIVYINKNIKKMKKNIIAGFNLSCLGDKGKFSIIPSRNGNSISDKVIISVLKDNNTKFNLYDWLDRGSDERQYCSPGVDLPVVSVSRSKYGNFPEYHTSLDNLDFVSAKYLNKSLLLFKRIINEIERSIFYKSKYLCEPKMSKRDLYPTISLKYNYDQTQNIMNVLSFCDGTNSILDIAKRVNLPKKDCNKYLNLLREHKLIDAFKI